MGTHRGRALVIEDSPEAALLVRGLLERESFEVVATPSGRRGVELARASCPDLVVLDLALPDVDGVEVCRQLRAFTDAYVVMVTARDDEVDRVVGLTVGADDYVTKPYSPRELAARVRALGRRPRTGGRPGVLDLGRLVVDTGSREVRLEGEPVPLTRLEFDLLALLAGRPRRVATREQILEALWGPWFGDDHVIEVHIGTLRRKLGESAAAPRHIRTVRGIGYRFEPD